MAGMNSGSLTKVTSRVLNVPLMLKPVTQPRGLDYHFNAGGIQVYLSQPNERKSITMTTEISLQQHYTPKNFSDRFALAFTKSARFFADTFFAHRYGHRAVVLETVAAVPGMVGGALQHLRALRRMESDDGWIHTLLDEAENERMHLMTFVHIAQPTWLERLIILLAQGIFFNGFFMLYLLSPRTAHRVVGYFEEEAVYSYTEYLAEVEKGIIPNVPAPEIAIEYWKLKPDARLQDVIVVVREDERHHRDVNHGFANELT
jgi:ubiquinol oxidase